MSNKEPDKTTAATEISYRDAMSELEELLDEIDHDGVDLDELALKVERAAELIKVCRQRIEKTELQVKSIIDEIEAPAVEGE